MAAVKTQDQSSEQSRSVTRPQDNHPSRDLFDLNPFSLMRRFSDEMDRAFGGAFSPLRNMAGSGVWSPPVEVRERDHNLEISAELPGMNKDDVKVEITQEGVILEGEKRREQESDEGGIHRTERSYGRFYRMIPLSDGADPEKANAEFKDGVLRVKIPISSERRKNRQIPISA